MQQSALFQKLAVVEDVHGDWKSSKLDICIALSVGSIVSDARAVVLNNAHRIAIQSQERNLRDEQCALCSRLGSAVSLVRRRMCHTQCPEAWDCLKDKYTQAQRPNILAQVAAFSQQAFKQIGLEN